MKSSPAALLLGLGLQMLCAVRIVKRRSAEAKANATEVLNQTAVCTALYSGIRGTREQYLMDAAVVAGLQDVELAQFMGQCAHECDSFNTMEEYASGNAYEGRTDLGNTQPGDGKRYKGRGYIQITGRYNYGYYGGIIGEDLYNNPTKAAEEPIAAKVALAYWAKMVKGLIGDFTDTTRVTRIINGGENGLTDRERKFAAYRSACGGDGGSVGEGEICKDNRGLCIDTSKLDCPRGVLSGLCPGGSNIKCCPSSEPGVGSPCSGDVAGTCIDTDAWWMPECPRSTLSGKCPGGASIKCCPYETKARNGRPVLGAGDSCDAGWVLNGTCINIKADTCHTETVAGKCAGSWDIRCCPRFPPA